MAIEGTALPKFYYIVKELGPSQITRAKQILMQEGFVEELSLQDKHMDQGKRIRHENITIIAQKKRAMYLGDKHVEVQKK